MTRVVRFYELGGPEVLRIEDLPPEEPSQGEVRLRIEAIGLNRSEVLFRRGQYKAAPSLPARIGYEASGVVEALGPGVDGFTEGQPVSVLPFFDMGRYGVYADRAVVPVQALVARPPGLDSVRAAAIWMPAFTALFGLTRALGRRPAPKDRLVVTAAASSVGLAAVRLGARAFGCERVIGVVRRHEKADAVRNAGGKPLVAGDATELQAALQDELADGATIAFDAVGGETLAALAESSAAYGSVLLYGALGGGNARLPAATTIFKHLTVRGFEIAEAGPGSSEFRRLLQDISGGIAEGWVVADIDRVAPLAEVTAMHRRLEDGEHTGKIVLETGCRS